jgi:hypothetical protein
MVRACPNIHGYVLGVEMFWYEFLSIFLACARYRWGLRLYTTMERR